MLRVWKAKMKRGVKAVFLMMLLLGSVSAMADSKLTAEECNDYPFKPVVGEITHAHTVIGKPAVVERHPIRRTCQALQATLDQGTWWRGRSGNMMSDVASVSDSSRS